jgi:type II secretory pathway component PulC
MKHPFWIINLGLLSLVLAAIAFIFISSVKIPPREDIEPSQVLPRKESKVAINIKKIYEDDLFGTYSKEIPHVKQLESTIPFPTPPAQQKIVIPAIIEPEFLDPLQVTLKGIIVVSSNDSKNRAMIQDNKTMQEGTYKVGDLIQDAQLIRIFKNKIIFLRLNGQQEVLYLREQDTKIDPAYSLSHEWDTVVKKTATNNYLINPKAFIEHVKNLTECIDLLNATTAYQQGKSLGLRIGNLTKSPFGNLIGLQNGDIVTSINNIPAQTTEERLAIYKNVTSLKPGNTITIKLIRKNRETEIVYTLEDFTAEAILPALHSFSEGGSPSKDEGQAEKQAAFLPRKNSETIKQQHYAFAPTVDKIKKEDHRMMLQKGQSLMHSSS